MSQNFYTSQNLSVVLLNSVINKMVKIQSSGIWHPEESGRRFLPNI